MARQPAADVSAAVHQVDDAGGQSFCMQHLDKPSSGARGQVAGLHHGGAANGQRERQLLGDDQEREVPRCDHAHDTDRFLDRYGQVVRAEAVVRIPVGMLGQAGGVVPDSRRTGNLVLGLGNGLSGLQRFDQGQLVALGLNACCDPAQQRSPFRAGRSGPMTSLEGTGCRGHRGVDVCLGGAAIAGDADIVRRAVAQDLLACAPYLLAIDDVGPDVGSDRRRVSAGDCGHVRCFRSVVLEC